ncbi:MAG: DUF2065 domain-containing protein [Zoogloeaceae bacterium]|jgi:uncharacterized protein YjeT (DUF2065 family)|nr:DUF2065 domain-containing protein [Zoogloeaceae bacterium]
MNFMLAFALMLALEGLAPLLAPAAWREIFRQLLALSDGQIRFVGLCSVTGGLVLYLALLYWVPQ